MGYTIAEKILSRHAGKKVKAGDVSVCSVDFCFGQDGTSELVIDNFYSLKRNKVSNHAKFCIAIDHSAPSPKQSISNIHRKLRKFGREQKLVIFDVGCGVCHQVIPESGFILPGDLVVGADSHTCTYGALNAFACGFGSTDVAVALATGKNWFKVPQTTKFLVRGKIPTGVVAKDIILHMIGQVGANGYTYKAIEFTGEAIVRLSMDGRFTISNMAVEMGAKCALFLVDQKTRAWLKIHAAKKINAVTPDCDASYQQIREWDISKLSPQVAKPHHVDNVCPIEEVQGKRINLAYLGTCTNGRLEDLALAAKILRSKRIQKWVTFVVAPASKKIYLQAAQKGILEVFLRSGAIVLPPGCGPCVGTHGGVPADNQVVLSTANRNFKGRMGNPRSFIFLASPLTIAASAIEGKIADPRRYLTKTE